MEIDHTRTERRLLDAALQHEAVVLDAGCGRTTRLRDYRDRISRLVGVDVDAEAGGANPYVDEFVLADLDVRLPFDDGTFDLVYANFVVEHLAHPDRAFAEWSRVLRPGGTLVLLTSNRANPVMALADRLPQWLRLSVKRRGAGVAERDVYPARYLANTPEALERVVRSAGLEPVSVEYVGTLHRYGVRMPGAATILRSIEATLPEARRSTIVAAYTVPVRIV